jgi:hypothetical protein
MHWWDLPIAIMGTALGLAAIFRPAWLLKDRTDAKKEIIKDSGMVMLGASALIADTKDMLGNW